jgi:hypothetical protein
MGSRRGCARGRWCVRSARGCWPGGVVLLLDALRVRLPAPVTELRGHLVPAMWTQFDATGLDLAREALHTTGGRL